ncbi:MAG: hypothetical protein IH989_05380 [Planctomycetes bacterium]|nr:hypothetical protein [Planctomycetota bacterium]
MNIATIMQQKVARSVAVASYWRNTCMWLVSCKRCGTMNIEKFTSYKTGKLVDIVTPTGRPAHAFVPEPLPGSWQVPNALWPLVAEARDHVGRLEQIQGILPNPTLLLNPLQRREALRSSSLEGTFAAPEELLLFEVEREMAQGAKVTATKEHNNRLEVFNYGEALRQGGIDVAGEPGVGEGEFGGRAMGGCRTGIAHVEAGEGARSDGGRRNERRLAAGFTGEHGEGCAVEGESASVMGRDAAFWVAEEARLPGDGQSSGCRDAPDLPGDLRRPADVMGGMAREFGTGVAPVPIGKLGAERCRVP